MREMTCGSGLALETRVPANFCLNFSPNLAEKGIFNLKITRLAANFPGVIVGDSFKIP